MEIFTVYVLHSPKFNEIYIGHTHDLIKRFHQHNSPENSGYTKSFQPWIVIHLEYFQSRADAMKREKQLKSSRGRNWIKVQYNLI